MATALAEKPTIAEAVVNKSGLGSGDRFEAANRIREQLAKDSPRSAVEAMRAEPTDRAKIERTIEKNISATRNPTTGVEDRDASGKKKRDATKPEFALHERATKAAALTNEYLAKGYDKLTDDQKKDLRTQVETSLRKVWPEAIRDAFKSLDMPARTPALIASIEAMLKDPSFAKRMKDLMDATGDNVIPDIPAEVVQRMEEAHRNAAAKDNEYVQKEAELKETITKYEDEFLSPSGAKGEKLKQIETLTGLEEGLNKDKTEKNIELDEIKEAIALLNQQLSIANRKGEDDIVEDKKKALRLERKREQDKKDEIAKIDKQLNEKKELEKEKQELEVKRKRLATEHIALEIQKQDAERAKMLAKVEFDEARAEREAREASFVGGLENVVSEAVRQQLEEETAAAEAAAQTLLDEEKAKTKDPGEVAILDQLGKRWDRQKTGISGNHSIDYRKDQIDRDFGTLLNAGPKEVLREMLVAQGGMTPAQIDAKLNDDAFVAKMQPKVVERLVTRRIQTGKINESEVRRIAESDWGVGMIDAAINNNRQVKDAVQRLKDEGKFKGSLKEWLKNNSDGKIKTLLLILFGIIAAPAVIGAGLGISAYDAMK